MFTALIVVHILASFAIIGIVLLQAGKGADIGSAFGGAGTQAVFGSMGTPTVLGKITTAIAIIFTLTSFSLALMGGERSGSVVREAPPAPSAPAPAVPTPGGPAPAAPAPAPVAPAPPGQTR
ncbi:MAG: preprotein translocase subunit SecG [Candidatus Rokuibacteriota bacterium]|nr:MAG: preprotein translocase subunit SecG [Candidatus Rokubacteria bacterium]